MKQTYDQQILHLLNQPGYQPLKPKALARRLKVSTDDYGIFRETLRELVSRGRVELTRKHTIQLATAHDQVVGVFRSLRSGGGFVRPKPGQGVFAGELYIRQGNVLDAASGDVVLVQIGKRPKRPGKSAEGRILQIIERASKQFVGTYSTANGEGFVHVDGNVFREPIFVGDAGAKGARENDKVVFEMLRFPSPEMTGEGVITEILGPRGKPDVDLLAIVRQFHLPDAFPEEVLEEARAQVRLYEDGKADRDRLDLTGATIVTIDPEDARDFDDAITVDRDEAGNWRLGVHIADVATFVQPGSQLDQEAKRRGTSVYLNETVLPMLPELISNGIASLQEGRPRFTKSVFMDLDPHGRVTHTEFANSVLKVTKRLTYPQVMAFFEEPGKRRGIPAEVKELLLRMRELALILRGRRRQRGFLELNMPEAKLEFDAHGKVKGAHYALHDESHELIEEFMLTANEAVAQKLADEGIAFLRRVHEKPDPLKLKAFAQFVRTLGIKMEHDQSRFELQKVLREVRDKPVEKAVHYSLLRSLKLAIYAPEEEGHFALASDVYCHFTSPIRRYPDLTVHRLLDRYLRKGKASSDYSELLALGEHCSFTERRAEKAERELVKVRLLNHIAEHVGEEMEMVITGVEEFGFFAQGTHLPVEGLVHVRTLTDDFYAFDSAAYTLRGRRTGKQYQLGMKVKCVIVKVDLKQRELDLKVAAAPQREAGGAHLKPTDVPRRRRRRGQKE